MAYYWHNIYKQRENIVTINIVLNTLDSEGNIVDTDNMDLQENQVSDIVDHAAQLIIVGQNFEATTPEFQSVLAELASALENAEVL
jgi:hypothetical protein